MKKKCMRLVKFQVDLKREGRPGDEATLTARLIDRPLDHYSLKVIDMTFKL